MTARIIPMTLDEYKNGGENLIINYSYSESPFGDVLTASTEKGLCCMAFCRSRGEVNNCGQVHDLPLQSGRGQAQPLQGDVDEHGVAFEFLREKYPNAKLIEKRDEYQDKAISIFSEDLNTIGEINLHLKGTGFQMMVWKELLRIPLGQLVTYGDIARRIGKPRACRAVGSAVGANLVAPLIPCHRVIRASGELGNYYWGPELKRIIVAWEANKVK